MVPAAPSVRGLALGSAIEPKESIPCGPPGRTRADTRPPLGKSKRQLKDIALQHSWALAAQHPASLRVLEADGRAAMAA